MRERKTDRRKHRRYAEHALIRFRLEEEATFRFGLCLELGEGGLRMAVDTVAGVGSRLIIHSHFAEGSQVFHFAALGEIAWESKDGERALMGVHFLDISPEDLAALQAYLEQKRARSLSA